MLTYLWPRYDLDAIESNEAHKQIMLQDHFVWLKTYILVSSPLCLVY